MYNNNDYYDYNTDSGYDIDSAGYNENEMDFEVNQRGYSPHKNKPSYDNPSHGYPSQDYPGHGYPNYGRPSHGKPTHGRPSHDRPTHDRPSHSAPSQHNKQPQGPPPRRIPPQSGLSYKSVDPGAIRRCLYNYMYIWLSNGQAFWFYPTFIGRNSISGYRWARYGWVYAGFDLDLIRSFHCS